MEVVGPILETCPDPLTVTRTNHALKVIRQTLSLYSPSELAFSFNGGKDSTVLLHLLRAGIQQYVQQNQGTGITPGSGLGGMHSFVFTHPDDFEEVQGFIRDMDAQYGLHVEFISIKDFKQGLVDFLARTGVHAVVLGTRCQDPNAGDQQLFCPSSEGWPPFMRVNPIFDWTYHDVWSFLLAAKVPYCQLYEQGFTSLGGKSNTQPNSALQREDGSYAPAYMLADARLERAGRFANDSKGAGAVPSSPHHCSTQQHTAALLLIGDELLAGKVTDTAAAFLCQELRGIGYSVTRVLILPDQVEVIAEELKRTTDLADVVITCGGIGPTLDDVTVEGVAMALGRPLVRHPEFERRLRDMFGPSLTAAHLKMAEAPAGASQLIDYTLDNGQLSRFPLLKCGANIFVLPGVPHLMRQKWKGLKEVLVAGRPLEPFHNQVFRLSLWDETFVARMLEEVQSQVGPEVTIGSYPVAHQPDGAQLLITLDSKNPEVLHTATKMMRALLPATAVISEEEDVKTLSRTSTCDGVAAAPKI